MSADVNKSEANATYRDLTPEVLAEKALVTLHDPVRYKPVETDGAARAARRIAQVLENRSWVR